MNLKELLEICPTVLEIWTPNLEIKSKTNQGIIELFDNPFPVIDQIVLTIGPKTKEQNKSYELLVTFTNRFPDVPIRCVLDNSFHLKIQKDKW